VNQNHVTDSCTNVLVEDMGNVLPEYEPAAECLGKFLDWDNNLDRYLYRASEISQITNGDLDEVTSIAGRLRLAANHYVVITAVHPNLEFVRVRFINSDTQEPDDGSGDYWVKVRELPSTSFAGLEIVEAEDNCSENDTLAATRIVQLTMPDTELPLCLTEQFVDCRPAVECSEIFGCNADGSRQHEVHVHSPFGNVGAGCDNAASGCEPDPCREWPADDQRHCGEDLQTEEDVDNSDASGPVHAILDGYFCSYAGTADGSIFKIRTVVGSEVWEYQYTHVGPETTSPGNADTYSYVAAGVYLGNYGDYGDTDPDHLHVHMVNKVYEYAAGTHPCAATTTVSPTNTECPVDTADDCPDNPYRRVDY
jgi:hypothetical protein